MIGTPIANRTRARIEALIGFFVNTLVLRTDLSGDADFGNCSRGCGMRALEASAHQDLPFEQLVEALQVPSAISSRSAAVPGDVRVAEQRRGSRSGCPDWRSG